MEIKAELRVHLPQGIVPEERSVVTIPMIILETEEDKKNWKEGVRHVLEEGVSAIMRSIESI